MSVVYMWSKEEDVTKDDTEIEEVEEEEEDVEDSGDDEGDVDGERTTPGGKGTKKSGRRRRRRAGEAGVAASKPQPDCMAIARLLRLWKPLFHHKW